MKFDNVNFSLLETSGFLVITDFLPKDVLEQLINKSSNFDKTANKNYSLGSFKIIDELKETIAATLTEIRRVTAIQTDLIPGEGIYFDNQQINFNWHQDHETYFKWQNCYNNLNFWMPIIKPIPNKSGVDVIPFDILSKHFPDITKEKFIGQGAKRIWTKNNNTLIVDDERGIEYVLPMSLDNIMVTPTLKPGDLLLMRGDCIHRTQDRDTNRIGISVLCASGDHWITKEKFYSGSNHKRNMINKNQTGFKNLISKFENQDAIQVKEVFN
jgi:hypothetical protein